MKKHLILLTVLFSLSLSSCTSDYDKGYNAGYMHGIKVNVNQNKAETTANNDYTKGYKAGLEKTMETVTVYGDFTATVRQLIPDYAYDSTTNRAAVITLFQSGPAIIRLNEEICSEIQAGETYTFEVAEQELIIPAYQLSDDNIIDINLDKLNISTFRTPAEDEYGLECWRVKYK